MSHDTIHGAKEVPLDEHPETLERSSLRVFMLSSENVGLVG